LSRCVDEPPAFGSDGLAIDEGEAKRSSKDERSNSGLLPLLLESFGHADETEGDQRRVWDVEAEHVYSVFFFTRSFSRVPTLAGIRGTRSSGGGGEVAQWLVGHARGVGAGSAMRPAACAVWTKARRAGLQETCSSRRWVARYRLPRPAAASMRSGPWLLTRRRCQGTSGSHARERLHLHMPRTARRGGAIFWPRETCVPATIGRKPMLDGMC